MSKLLRSIVILVAVLLSHNANAAEVNVYAAASLTDVMKEIAANYEKQSTDKVVFNFGASSLLARQIIERAPADIFFSADEAKMDDLQKAGLIATETRRDLLSNSLVIVVPFDSKLTIASPEELISKTQKIAIATRARCRLVSIQKNTWADLVYGKNLNRKLCRQKTCGRRLPPWNRAMSMLVSFTRLTRKFRER